MRLYGMETAYESDFQSIPSVRQYDKFYQMLYMYQYSSNTHWAEKTQLKTNNNYCKNWKGTIYSPLSSSSCLARDNFGLEICKESNYYCKYKISE